MKTRFTLARTVLLVLSLFLSSMLYAQYEDPLVIDDNYQPYEYAPVTGTPLQIGRGPQGNGSVFFETNPRGAKVFIDDVYQGQTPLRITTIEDGSYSVRFEMDGYLNYYANFDVAARLESHVTAGLQPRPHYFFDRKELYTTIVFEQSKVNAQGWGVGNSWGGYINHINLEQSTMVHIGVTNTVAFEAAAGWSFMMGALNRFRLTPQIGYSGVWFDNVGTAKSYWSGYLRGALNFKCAFTEQYAISASFLYDKTGPGFRAGVLFYVN